MTTGRGTFYTVFIGVPLCVVLVAVGLFFCITVIGLPIGLTPIALGFKYLTLGRRRFL